MALCTQEWDIDVIRTGVEQVVYTIAVADLATDLRMSFGNKIPFAAITSKESFQSDVDAFKNDMAENVRINAEAFFELVQPAWESVVL